MSTETIADAWQIVVALLADPAASRSLIARLQSRQDATAGAAGGVCQARAEIDPGETVREPSFS